MNNYQRDFIKLINIIDNILIKLNNKFKTSLLECLKYTGSHTNFFEKLLKYHNIRKKIVEYGDMYTRLKKINIL